MATDWLKQKEKPLFPNIFWEAPINRLRAKKLLIVGGHAKQFAETVAIYQAALASGIGEAKVVLPQALHRLAGKQANILYAPSTPSGSLARNGASEILAYARESDGVIFSDELSHNSETVTLLETLFTDISKPLFFGSSIIEILLFRPSLLVGESRTIICNAKPIMKLANALNMPTKHRPQESLLSKLEFVGRLSLEHQCSLVVCDNPLLASSQGQVSSTPAEHFYPDATAILTGLTATLCVQHSKPFEALTSAAFVLSQTLRLPEQGNQIMLTNLKDSLKELQSH